MRLMMTVMRFVFHLLYHEFAWSYDLVAGVVSLGRWKGWVLSSLPHLEGRMFEIGYGPGHLQEALQAEGRAAFGLDVSPQMAHQASRRLGRKGFPVNLVRGVAQHLPFQANAFETIVATFPSEYIYEAQTLAEARRVLVPKGRLVILPMAWITGGGILDRLAAWLFRVTGQAGAIESVLPAIRKRLQSAGFAMRHELVEMRGSWVLVILAEKNTSVEKTC